MLVVTLQWSVKSCSCILVPREVAGVFCQAIEPSLASRLLASCLLSLRVPPLRANNRLNVLNHAIRKVLEDLTPDT